MEVNERGEEKESERASEERVKKKGKERKSEGTDRQREKSEKRRHSIQFNAERTIRPRRHSHSCACSPSLPLLSVFLMTTADKQTGTRTPCPTSSQQGLEPGKEEHNRWLGKASPPPLPSGPGFVGYLSLQLHLTIDGRDSRTEPRIGPLPYDNFQQPKQTAGARCLQHISALCSHPLSHSDRRMGLQPATCSLNVCLVRELTFCIFLPSERIALIFQMHNEKNTAKNEEA